MNTIRTFGLHLTTLLLWRYMDFTKFVSLLERGLCSSAVPICSEIRSKGQHLQ